MLVVVKIISKFRGQTLATNIFYKDSGKLYLLAKKIIEKDDIKISFIGATTPFVPVFESKVGCVQQMVFTQLIPEIKKQVEYLK